MSCRRCALAILLWSGLATAQQPAAPARPSGTAVATDPPPPKAAPPAPNLPEPRGPQDDAYSQLELLTHAMQTIRRNYVDENRIGYAQLIEGALEGMLRKLDPHCEYMGKALFEELKREQSDESTGIGVVISLRDGNLSIAAIRDDGPAARAGVLSGDQILQIDEVLTESLGVAEAVQLLEGRSGEKIKLVLRRPSSQKIISVDLTRETLTESSVSQALMLPPRLGGAAKIGWLRISQFTEATAGNLSEALDDLQDRGLQALVLDLRNNPGGLLESAVAVCGEFLPPKTMVVSIEGRNAADSPPPYRTAERAGKRLREFPMAILINHASASAAEIVAGALQDLGRAIVVGTPSFGKGSVQSVVPLSNGAAMRLTIAKYYTPSHRTIHGNGISPDIVATLDAQQELRVNRWRANPSSGEAAALELANLGDAQLERATDALKGALIFQSLKPASAPVSAPESNSTQKPGAPAQSGAMPRPVSQP
jgi:carboxyl-terminal processing protease